MSPQQLYRYRALTELLTEEQAEKHRLLLVWAANHEAGEQLAELVKDLQADKEPA